MFPEESNAIAIGALRPVAFPLMTRIGVELLGPNSITDDGDEDAPESFVTQTSLELSTAMPYGWFSCEAAPTICRIGVTLPFCDALKTSIAPLPSEPPIGSET